MLGPHGIKGEVRVYPLTDFPERFLERDRLLASRPDGSCATWYSVEGARFHQDLVILKLGGIDERTAAQGLRGWLLCVAEDELPPLGEGQFYHHQLIGLVVQTTDGREIGVLEEIYSTGANDVFVVRAPGEGDKRQEHLIPATKEVIRSVDLVAKRMVVEAIPGLLE